MLDSEDFEGPGDAAPTSSSRQEDKNYLLMLVQIDQNLREIRIVFLDLLGMLHERLTHSVLV